MILLDETGIPTSLPSSEVDCFASSSDCYSTVWQLLLLRFSSLLTLVITTYVNDRVCVGFHRSTVPKSTFYSFTYGNVLHVSTVFDRGLKNGIDSAARRTCA